MNAFPSIEITLSEHDHMEIVRLLDASHGRITYRDVWGALLGRNVLSGRVRMSRGDAEEFLEWLRGRARTATAAGDDARAVILDRVAVSVTRALHPPPAQAG